MERVRQKPNESFEDYYHRRMVVQALVNGAPKLQALVVKLVEGSARKYCDQMKMKTFDNFNQVLSYAKRLEKYEEEEQWRQEQL